MQTFETCPLSFFYNVTCGENILRDIYFLVFLEREFCGYILIQLRRIISLIDTPNYIKPQLNDMNNLFKFTNQNYDSQTIYTFFILRTLFYQPHFSSRFEP
jgi:hypothetical protein